MNTQVIYLLFIALIVAPTLAAPAQDQVKFNVAGYTNKWYSGYLSFMNGDFHYVFFHSQNNPTTDPIVLWFNGGPGCSSLIGLFLQNGPFIFQTNTTNIKLNEFSWNRFANVLYIQTPGTVGFSKGKRDNVYNDDTTAQDNYLALVAFYKKFPQFAKNQLFISGQSYAGIYIPYLALQIVDKNKSPETNLKINLKGLMIGNACTDPRQCYEPTYGGLDGQGMSIYQYQFLHKHDYISNAQYEIIKSQCISDYASDACKSIRKIVNKQFSDTLTVINNIYQPCYHQKIPFGKVPKFLQGRKGFKSMGQEQTCEDLIGIMTFLNTADVQRELHVDRKLYEICNEDVENKYVMNKNASYWIYPILHKEQIKVWIYSGDVDANVPIIGTLNWINRMRQAQSWTVSEPWREWWAPGHKSKEDQVAGLVWKLQGLTFVSVRGAGHMAPGDRPRQTQIMIQTFIQNKDLPRKRL